jgi:exodeoxyribonuclease VII small subunit
MGIDMSESGESAQNPGLEDRLARLEEIVAALESGELELDAALKLFEEGVVHLRETEALLASAELRVEELLNTAQGDETRDFGRGDGS